MLRQNTGTDGTLRGSFGKAMIEKTEAGSACQRS